MTTRVPQAVSLISIVAFVLLIGTRQSARCAAPPAKLPSTAPATRPGSATFVDPENARQIIFMCDASGSMINKWNTLKGELSAAIGALQQNCTFNVIFFQDGRATALNRSAMVPASAEGKKAAREFLEKVTTTSTSDPMPGLVLGFRLHPDVIYLLTDGDFPDNDAVLKKVRELNRPAIAPKAVKVHTIAFTNAKDTDEAFLKLLEQIAKENGGTFRHVDEDKVGRSAN